MKMSWHDNMSILPILTKRKVVKYSDHTRFGGNTISHDPTTRFNTCYSWLAYLHKIHFRNNHQIKKKNGTKPMKTAHTVHRMNRLMSPLLTWVSSLYSGIDRAHDSLIESARVTSSYTSKHYPTVVLTTYTIHPPDRQRHTFVWRYP